jgi:hypothetical protein
LDSFWEFFWFVVWTFVLFAYLMILFQIVIDLFRDHALSGWAKAAWIIGLIFLPFLTALIYVIARGPRMSERQLAAAQAAKSNTDAYIRDVAGSKSAAAHIADAKALLDSGAITDAEFQTLKAKALAA